MYGWAIQTDKYNQRQIYLSLSDSFGKAGRAVHANTISLFSTRNWRSLNRWLYLPVTLYEKLRKIGKLQRDAWVGFDEIKCDINYLWQWEF